MANQVDPLIQVVTCCVGKSDYAVNIQSLACEFPFITFIAYVDCANLKSFAKAGWKTELIAPSACSGLSTRLISRIPKLNPSKLINSVNYVLWIDSNVLITKPFLEHALFLVRSKKFILCAFRHQKRSSPISEAIYCFIFSKISLIQFLRSLRLYSFHNSKASILWGGVLLWNIGSASSVGFQELWIQLTLLIGRDQIPSSALIYSLSDQFHYIDNQQLKLLSTNPHRSLICHDVDPFSSLLARFIRFPYYILCYLFSK